MQRDAMSTDDLEDEIVDGAKKERHGGQRRLLKCSSGQKLVARIKDESQG